MELPRIISVDDHVLEPPDLWTSRLPARFRDRGPRVVRERGLLTRTDGSAGWIADADAPNSTWADVWYYDDLVWPITRGYAMSGHEDDDALRSTLAKPFTPQELLQTIDEVLAGRKGTRQRSDPEGPG